MKLVVYSEQQLQSLQCSYDNSNLVAHGEWEDITSRKVIHQFIGYIDNPESDKDFKSFIYYFNKELGSLTSTQLQSALQKATAYIEGGTGRISITLLEEYVAILLNVLVFHNEMTLKNNVFEALLSVILNQHNGRFVVDEVETVVINAIFDFLHNKEHCITTYKVCLQILESLAEKKSRVFFELGRFKMIFKILRQPNLSEIFKNLQNLIEKILIEVDSTDLLYISEALPSLVKTLKYGNGTTQSATFIVYGILAQKFKDYPDIIKKLNANDIVLKTCSLMMPASLDNKPMVESLICYFSHRESETTICKLQVAEQTGSLGIGFTFNIYFAEITFAKSETDMENATTQSVTYAFRLSQEMFLNPWCDMQSKFCCLKSFLIIMELRGFTEANSKWWLQWMKYENLIGQLVKILSHLDDRLIIASLEVINMMLQAMPERVSTYFRKLGLSFALKRNRDRWQNAKKDCLKQMSKFPSKYSNLEHTLSKTKSLLKAFKITKNLFLKTKIGSIDQTQSTFQNLKAAIKKIHKKGEFDSIQKVFEENQINTYMILETGLVRTLLYFLIGVEDIKKAQPTHPSEITLHLGDRQKTIRNNRIKKFIKAFLGCQAESSTPPVARHISPFATLIDHLHSALAVVGSLHSPFGVTGTNFEVQKLLHILTGINATSIYTNRTSNMLETYLVPHFPHGVSIEDPSTEIISLINVLYGINQHYEDLYPSRTFSPPLPQEYFVNNYLTQIFNTFIHRGKKCFDRLLPLNIWKIGLTCSFLIAYKTRLEAFKTLCSFWDCSKGLFRKQLENSESHCSNVALFAVNRNNIIEESKQYFTSSLSNSKKLQVQFKNEPRDGLDNTQEYYNVISNEFRNAKFNLWRESSLPTNKQNSHENIPLNAETSSGLYPKPTSSHKNLEQFELLGKIMAKVMTDCNTLDLRLHELVFKSLLGYEYHMGLDDIYKLDSNLGNILKNLQKIAGSHSTWMHLKRITNNSLVDDQLKSFESRLVENTINPLCLNFTLPEQPEIELKEGGRDIKVNIANVGEYVQLVIQWTLKKGILNQMDAIRKGFNSILPGELLRLFNYSELGRIFYGFPESPNLHMKNWHEYFNYNEKSQVLPYSSESLSEHDPFQKNSQNL